MSEASMDLYEVQRRVVEISAVSYDDEKAHSEDDQLRADVLRAIANGAPNASELAAAVLRTDDLGFCRWYA